LENARGTTLVEGTRRVKETIEPGEAMPNVGASDGTEVYRACASGISGRSAMIQISVADLKKDFGHKI
jgi:hypothetical protein